LCSSQINFRLPAIITDVKSFPSYQELQFLSTSKAVFEDSLHLKFLTFFSFKDWWLHSSRGAMMGLQQTHMKGGVKLPRCWQIQLVGGG
jgi:hypothetical protein